MQNSKLIQVLKKFSLKEMKELEKFMESSLFNNSKKTYSINCLLIQYILKNHAKIESNALSKEVVFSKLFPNLDYNKNARKLRDLSSNVLKIVENFIVIRQIKKDSFKYQIELLQFYNMLELDRHYSDAYKTFIEHLEKNINKGDAEFYRNKYIAEFVSTKYEVNKSSTIRNKKNLVISTIITATQDFDLYYLINQMELYCYLITRLRVLKQEPYISPILAIVLDNIENTPYYSNIAIQIFHQTILMLQNNDKEEHYYNLKKLIYENYQFSNPLTVYSIFLHAQNYCIQKITEGNKKYYNEYQGLYHFQLEKGILSNISAAVLKNIVTSYLNNGQPSNAQKFIDTYLDRVEPKKLQKEVYMYNSARLRFYDKDYKGVLKILLGENTEHQQVRVPKFEDIYYQIAARSLLLKTYYELKNGEEVDLMWENLKQFIWQKQKVISNIGFDRFNNFVMVFRKLHSLPIDKRSRHNQLKEINDIIGSNIDLAERTWLLQKLEAL